MKTDIEKLVEIIYHKQTYGKDCDKEIEKLNRLTGVIKEIPKAKNISSNLLVMRSSKFLKPQVKYLLKMIDEDIEKQKKFLVHLTEWMEKMKPTDKYYERQTNATHKKISFAEKCREKILNFA